MLTQQELKELTKPKTYAHSIPRTQYITKIKPWLDNKEIIILKGIRRCGKTHIMHQLIQTLPQTNVFYANFDQFQYDQHLSIQLLEEILNLRNKKEKAYFFFDEIQRIQGFEKWLRTYYDKEENIKFIIGGSNTSLLTPTLATVLTGRNITFIIKTLNYTEYQEFTSNPTLEEYLTYGGFPEIVQQDDNEKKKQLLQQYIEDIIVKDILYKTNTEHTKQLRGLAIHLINNPGTKITANKLGKRLGIHKDTAQKYLEHIKDAFIIFKVPHHLHTTKTKYIANQAPKYYVTDNGLHTAVTTKKNTGILYENLIAITLQEQEPTYWQNNKTEIDFITKTHAIQVTATNNPPTREQEAFKEFKKKNPKYNHILITPETTPNSTAITTFITHLKKKRLMPKQSMAQKGAPTPIAHQQKIIVLQENIHKTRSCPGT